MNKDILRIIKAFTYGDRGNRTEDFRTEIELREKTDKINEGLFELRRFIKEQFYERNPFINYITRLCFQPPEMYYIRLTVVRNRFMYLLVSGQLTTFESSNYIFPDRTFTFPRNVDDLVYPDSYQNAVVE